MRAGVCTVTKAGVQQGKGESDGRQDTQQGREDAEDEVLLQQVEADGETALKDDQNQANVAQRQERILPLQREDVGDGHAVDQADDNLANQPGAEDLVREPFGDAEQDEEGDQRQYADYVGLMVREKRAARVGGHCGADELYRWLLRAGRTEARFPDGRERLERVRVVVEAPSSTIAEDGKEKSTLQTSRHSQDHAQMAGTLEGLPRSPF